MRTYRIIKRTVARPVNTVDFRTPSGEKPKEDFYLDEYFIIERKGWWKWHQVDHVFRKREEIYDCLHKTGKYTNKSKILEYITI